MRDFNELFKAGNKAQLEKIELYSHKKDWTEMSFDEIAHLIYEESEEVYEEVIKRSVNIKNLRNECADLSNACHFMIMLCDRIIKEKEL